MAPLTPRSTNEEVFALAEAEFTESGDFEKPLAQRLSRTIAETGRNKLAGLGLDSEFLARGGYVRTSVKVPLEWESFEADEDGDHHPPAQIQDLFDGK